MKRPFFTLVCALLVLVPTLQAAEGKWTPAQVLEQDPQWLADLGLEIPPETLWGPEGGGLLDASVYIGGCTAAFVSPDGLLLTNHHCAFWLIQQHSSPEADLLTDGFLATDRAAELPGRGTRATVPHAFHDVTTQIEASVPEGADDLERHHVMERRGKELVAECEQRPFRRCKVAAFDDGLRWELVEMLEFPDVRLVWSPPRAVGDYGGEVDNWMWPRHAGDFSLLRVYADADNRPAERSESNRPYRPAHFFPVSGEGVDDGDFIMVTGYPGRTYRRFIAAETELYLDRYFPQRAELYRGWMDIMEEASKAGEDVRIALAGRIKSLANGEKNARGQVAGIRRGDLVEAKRSLEAEVLAWASDRPEYSAAASAHRQIARLTGDRRATWDRDFLLRTMYRGPVPLGDALMIVRWARERGKPDIERLPGYQDRDRDRLIDRLRNSQRRLHAPTEAELLADLLERADQLPAGQRIRAFEALLDDQPAPDALLERARKIIQPSALLELEPRLAMLDNSAAELEALDDPLLELAFALDDELRALEEEDDRRDGALSRLRPTWRRAVAAHLDRPLDPDANSTLRVSFGHVRGYSPRDAVWMLPQTTLDGLLAKHTGAEPFDAPEAIRRRAAEETPAGRWADAELGDLPICFLADGDTTGGNSGSPVVNARGELVGVNFDRVWENVANDFGYNPAIARNVSVDVRYLLWMLEEVEGQPARWLLEELGFGGLEAASAAD